MPKKMTLSQQRAMLKALPNERHEACRHFACKKQMEGSGITEIMKSIGSVVGPIWKEIGPTIMKEFVMPFIKKQLSGSGNIYKSGSGLKLAGQGKKKRNK